MAEAADDSAASFAAAENEEQAEQVENPRRSVDTYVRVSPANRRNTMAAREEDAGRVDALLVVVGTHSTRECVLFHIK